MSDDQALDPAEYSGLDATAMANLVRLGEVAADELRAAATARHEATTETINAVVEWYEQPDPVNVNGKAGALAGVPFLRKDYGSTEPGRLVEMGSLLAAGHTATSSSDYFDRIKGAGAQVLGRSAVPELIQHGSTESRATGVTRNPHDPTLSAGGSSGGAGAAVAAGVVPAAHASDCAGSIRIPAAVCGLFGLKPTRRVVPWRDGGWGGLAEEFVVTRTLRDVALFWEVLSGRGLAPAPKPEGLRVALSVDHWAGSTPDSLVVAATQTAAVRLEEQGHRVEVVPQPVDNEQLMSTWHPLFSRWVGRDVDSLVVKTGRAVGLETLEPLTLLLLDEVRRLTVDDVSDAQVEQGRITRRLEVAMASFDVLITPTLGRPTIPLDTLAGEVESMEDYLRLNDETFPYSYLFNVAGWPAFSVPWPALSSESGVKHPLGVQLIGRPGSEPQLLALAEQLS